MHCCWGENLPSGGSRRPPSAPAFLLPVLIERTCSAALLFFHTKAQSVGCMAEFAGNS